MGVSVAKEPESKSRAFARRLIEPHAAIADPGERRQARLLAALLLVFTPLVAATILIAPRLANPGNSPWSDPMFIVGSGVLVVYGAAYFLARRRRWRIAAYTFVAVAILGTWSLIALSDESPWEEGAPAFLLISVLFSSLFLDVKSTTFLAIFNVGSLLIYGPRPGVDTGTFAIHIIVQVIMPPIIIAASVLRHQDLQQIEGQRVILQQAEAQFRGVVESAADALIMVDGTGNIVLVNGQAEKSFGYHRSEMIGQPVELLVPRRFAKTHPKQRDAYIAHPVTRPMGMGLDLYARRKDGSEFPVEISLSPIQSQQGTLVLSIVRDITQRKQADEARELSVRRQQEIETLHQINEVKTKLLNTASHELNTPLTPIRLQLHVLRSGNANLTPGQRKAVEILDRNFARLSALVSDILDVARQQAGHVRLNPGALNLDAAVREAVETYGTNPEPVIKLDLGLGEAQVTGDSLRMHQVLLNLLSNARKFTPKTGLVRVRTSREGNMALVEVHDTGLGLTKAQIDQLFQPFTQVHDPMSLTEAGTGLGLYISKGLVEAHGGTMGCRSDGPGQGSTFWFTLPFAPS